MQCQKDDVEIRKVTKEDCYPEKMLYPYCCGHDAFPDSNLCTERKYIDTKQSSTGQRRVFSEYKEEIDLHRRRLLSGR